MAGAGFGPSWCVWCVCVRVWCVVCVCVCGGGGSNPSSAVTPTSLGHFLAFGSSNAMRISIRTSSSVMLCRSCTRPSTHTCGRPACQQLLALSLFSLSLCLCLSLSLCFAVPLSLCFSFSLCVCASSSPLLPMSFCVKGHPSEFVQWGVCTGMGVVHCSNPTEWTYAQNAHAFVRVLPQLGLVKQRLGKRAGDLQPGYAELCGRQWRDVQARCMSVARTPPRHADAPFIAPWQVAGQASLRMSHEDTHTNPAGLGSALEKDGP